jgi:uncharacterized protein YndB with AHSA1/START domain
MVLPDGETIDWVGHYLEVAPPERLVLDFTDRPDIPEYDLFTITLHEDGATTHMTLRQSGGHLSDEEYEQARIGTASFVDAIEDLLRDEILKMRHDTGQ